MSVTEFKRRSKKTYFLMGTAAALLPALAAVLFLGLQLGDYRQKNRILEQELNQTTKETGYVLKEDVAKGRRIEEGMLQEVVLRGEKRLFIRPAVKDELVGKYAKCSFVKGTPLNPQCVYEEDTFSDDMRIQDFSFMEINNMVRKEDYIDVRIVYPSGEDYIVANHKKVLDIQSNEQVQESYTGRTKLFLEVTEEEILRIASAYVDMLCYPGSRIYVLSYLDQFQQAGIVNYPVNPQVFELLGWNPNVTSYTASEQEKQQRSILEEHLSAYVLQGTQSIVQRKMDADDPAGNATSFFE